MASRSTDSNDNFGVSPAQMDIDSTKAADNSKHVEDVESKEWWDYYQSAEFKARERRVVRKMDFYIAPLMGSFNFIVNTIPYDVFLTVVLKLRAVVPRSIKYRLRSNPRNGRRPQISRIRSQRAQPSCMFSLPRLIAIGRRIHFLRALRALGGLHSPPDMNHFP